MFSEYIWQKFTMDGQIEDYLVYCELSEMPDLEHNGDNTKTAVI